MSFLTKLYQTINQPKLIDGYFKKLQLQLMVDAPRKIRTDYGLENKDVAVFQIFLRLNDPDDERPYIHCICYKYKKSKDWELMGILCNFGLNSGFQAGPTFPVFPTF